MIYRMYFLTPKWIGIIVDRSELRGTFLLLKVSITEN